MECIYGTGVWRKDPEKKLYFLLTNFKRDGFDLKIMYNGGNLPLYPIREYKIQSPLTVEVSFNLRGVGSNIRVIVQGCKRNWYAYELP